MSLPSLTSGELHCLDACSDLVRGHEKIVSSLHGSVPPLCVRTYRFTLSKGSSSDRVGALGTESVQYPYAAERRRVLYTTICHSCDIASRLPVRHQSASSISFNLSESRPIKTGGVK
jgi:hypothetical protein